MLYANVHILDINISEKCQKRKDMASSSSMQPRKHASRLTTKRKPSLFRSPKVTHTTLLLMLLKEPEKVKTNYV